MIIIPTSDAPNGISEAKLLLNEVVRQRRKVSCFVFGDTPNARSIASRADVRAEDHPARQVVWVPDPSALNGEGGPLTKLAQLAANDVAVFFTLEFAHSVTLSGSDAQRFSRLELAFANALAGILAS